VAIAAPDPSGEIAVKVESPSTQPALELVVGRRDNEPLGEADSDSEEADDEDADDEEPDDEGESSDSNSPNDDSVHEESLTNQPLPEQRLDHQSSTHERTDSNGVPPVRFYFHNKADSVQLPHPGALPREVFAHSRLNHPWLSQSDSSKLTRMVRHDDPYEVLVYASAFLLSGTPRRSARAGCSILTRTDSDRDSPYCEGFLLEKTKPNGKPLEETPYNQKRADLRAVVAALENQMWGSEGWKKVTIATKSSYVYNGMTKFVGKWKDDNWRANSRRGPSEVLNADLWARALDLVNDQAYHGCETQFWLLPRDHSMKTDDHARWLARESDLAVPEVYVSFGPVNLAYMYA
jgi:hypothetical protein